MAVCAPAEPGRNVLPTTGSVGRESLQPTASAAARRIAPACSRPDHVSLRVCRISKVLDVEKERTRAVRWGDAPIDMDAGYGRRDPEERDRKGRALLGPVRAGLARVPD